MPPVKSPSSCWAAGNRGLVCRSSYSVLLPRCFVLLSSFLPAFVAADSDANSQASTIFWSFETRSQLEVPGCVSHHMIACSEQVLWCLHAFPCGACLHVKLSSSPVMMLVIKCWETLSLQAAFMQRPTQCILQVVLPIPSFRRDTHASAVSSACLPHANMCSCQAEGDLGARIMDAS